MALTREQKGAQIDEIVKSLEESKSFVIVSYKGISVADDTALRAKFTAAGITYKVLNTRLSLRAMEKLGISGYEGALEGSTAVAFSMTDPLAGPKVISEMSATVKALEVKCGRMDNMYLDVEKVNALAKIPSKETLLAQLLGMLLSPVTGLAVALNQVAEKQAQ